MKILKIQGQSYIDKEFFDYLNRIWTTFDVTMEDNSNLYFLPNCTVPRTICEYNTKNISRVIKKEKVDYLVLHKIDTRNYPIYSDGTSIFSTDDDDTKEVVYGTHHFNTLTYRTIEKILEFYNINKDIKFVNEAILIDSLHNGTEINKDNYTSYKELIKSTSHSDHQMVAEMIIKCNLKTSWEWLICLYFGDHNRLFNYDDNDIIHNYIYKEVKGRGNYEIFNNFNTACSIVKNEDVKEELKRALSEKFHANGEQILRNLGAGDFKLVDFIIKYEPDIPESSS